MSEKRKWYASEYLDDGRFGVLDEDGTIIVGLSSRITEGLARQIANDHNNAISLTGRIAALEPQLASLREKLVWIDDLLDAHGYRTEGKLRTTVRAALEVAKEDV